LEIEKKYIIINKPKILNFNKITHIKQGYLKITKPEIRVRKKNTKYYITIKGEEKLIRNEWETEIPKWVFYELWKNTKNMRIEKIRYAINDNDNNNLEIDFFKNNLEGLYILECEFKNENDAMNFNPPKWLGTINDVTNDKRYYNKNLAQHGIPQLKE